MEMVSPASDPKFLASKQHGVLAQLSVLDQVVKLCKQHRVAVDVGAHVGTWTVPLSIRFEHVLAFEPQPENFECLRQNVVSSRVEIRQVALADREGTCDIASHAGGNSGCFRAAPGTSTLVERLDMYSLRGVDLIKIDVEGYEGLVLIGAAETLEHSSPVIIFEDNGVGPKFYGDSWVDPKTVLAGLGYKRVRRIFKDEVWTR